MIRVKENVAMLPDRKHSLPSPHLRPALTEKGTAGGAARTLCRDRTAACCCGTVRQDPVKSKGWIEHHAMGHEDRKLGDGRLLFTCKREYGVRGKETELSWCLRVYVSNKGLRIISNEPLSIRAQETHYR